MLLHNNTRNVTRHRCYLPVVVNSSSPSEQNSNPATFSPVLLWLLCFLSSLNHNNGYFVKLLSLFSRRLWLRAKIFRSNNCDKKMLKPLTFASIGESEKKENSSLLIEGSGIFPPLQKLFRRFQKRSESDATSTSTLTNTATLPSIARPGKNIGSFSEAEKSDFDEISNVFSGFEPVNLSSCTYTYTPSVMAAGFRQKYWSSFGSNPPCNLSR